MKRLRDHNRHRQWTKREKEEDPEVKAARRVFGESRKVGRSLRSRVSKVANGEYPLRNLARPKAVLLLAILLVSGVFIADQAWKGTTGISPIPIIDPVTLVWGSGLKSGDLAGWNNVNAYYDASAGGVAGLDGITLKSNSTHAGIAVSENPVGDLSLAAGKHLAMYQNWYVENATGCCGYDLGYYLTTNSTVPLTPNYDPANDKSVFFLFKAFDAGGGNFLNALYLKRDPLSTSIQDPGGCSGDCFISETTATDITAPSGNGMFWVLNFTGNTGPISGNNQVSWICTGLLGGADSCTIGATITMLDKQTTVNFPWFQLTGNYYLGYWQEAKASTQTIAFGLRTISGTAFEVTGSILLMVPSPPASPSPVEPKIDTGGFFGPIIKALISIGVFILASIATFLGYLADVFVTAMNAVGTFFGLGAIGTAIRDALTGTANFIVNVFAVTVGWAVTLASLFQNGIGFLPLNPPRNMGNHTGLLDRYQHSGPGNELHTRNLLYAWNVPGLQVRLERLQGLAGYGNQADNLCCQGRLLAWQRDVPGHPRCQKAARSVGLTVEP